MALTFEQFKKEVIDRQKALEINQFLHLYIKAANYQDILSLVKQADLRWAFSKGVIDDDLIKEIPMADLNAQNFYDDVVLLSDINSNTIYVLGGGDLTLTQSLQNRCKVVLLGGSLTGTTNDESMIELESYMGSSFSLTANNGSYLHLTNRGLSTGTVNLNDDSILKLNAADSSQTTINEGDNSFVNIIAVDNSMTTVNSLLNCTIKKGNNAKVNEIYLP